jgi:hypothetical protein
MTTPRIYVDFQNADPLGRVHLNTIGGIESLAVAGVCLVDGLEIIVHDEELEADGIVRYSDEEGIWVATIDWDAIRQISQPSVVR